MEVDALVKGGAAKDFSFASAEIVVEQDQRHLCGAGLPEDKAVPRCAGCEAVA